jgi:eukaryotic-like serine/threonine-protein kinase
MSIRPGAQVGPYEVVSPLGAGGMGEVYRARDPKLNRDVAIKVLPDSFALDTDRLTRFTREARTLASLNHPNIAHIHGLEQFGAGRALVMEMVEGEDLSAWIARGPMPLADVLPIARQIADALETAHEQGIVHRDLKPANIKVRADGTVKVLDFGLAKAMDPAAPSSADAMNSPTMMSPVMTQPGAVLGTAAYMAPEQARGKAVDRRADIWAFGAVLFEMLTGRTPFGGATIADALSAVVRDEPDWTRLPPTVGPRVRALLRRCLQKDPRQRLRDIGDARVALEETISTGDPAEGLSDTAGRTALAWAFAVSLPAGHWIPLDEAPVLALSCDARVLVFVAASSDGRRLFRRDLQRLSVSAIAGTQGASGPFLSPDGCSVGFFAAGWLKRVPVEGGVPTTLCEVTSLPRGACWTRDGRIVFSPAPDRELMVVADTGGTAHPLTRLDAGRYERSHRWPDVLSDGRSVLYTVGSTLNAQDYDEVDIGLASLETGDSRIVFRGARMARAAGAQEMLVQRRTTVLRVRIGSGGSTPAIPGRTVLEGVAGEASSGSGYFAAAGGVLAYAPVNAVAERLGLLLVDRAGQSTRLPVPSRGYRYPRVSPDGAQIAFHIADDRDLDARGTRGDVWVLALESRRLGRVTVGGGSTHPCWNPDGRRLAFFRAATPSGVYERAVVGGRSDTPLWAAPVGAIKLPETWHPDGSWLVVQSVDRAVKLWRVRADGAGEPEPLGPDLGDQWGASLSPDGRYLAYTSIESGLADVYVEALSGDQGRWQVSTDGGMFPVWSPDGRELFYVCGDTMMAVEVAAGPTAQPGMPIPLFRCPVDLQTPPTRNFDVLPDGRFVMVARADQGERPEICVMANL